MRNLVEKLILYYQILQNSLDVNRLNEIYRQINKKYPEVPASKGNDEMLRLHRILKVLAKDKQLMFLCHINGIPHNALQLLADQMLARYKLQFYPWEWEWSLDNKPLDQTVEEYYRECEIYSVN